MMRTMHIRSSIAPAALMSIGSALLATAARADDFAPFDLELEDGGAIIFAAQAAGEPKADDRLPEPPGEADRVEIEPYAIGAADFHGNTIFVGGAGAYWFPADRVAVGFFVEGAHVNQDGANAMGAGFGASLRWFFAETKSMRVYAEAGVGFMLFDEPVPSDATTGLFTPRASLGAMLPIDANSSLTASIGWLHMSNAQTGENNSGIDTLAIGLGLSIRF